MIQAAAWGASCISLCMIIHSFLLSTILLFDIICNITVFKLLKSSLSLSSLQYQTP